MATSTSYYLVVVFDLDGTLLRRTTVSLLLAIGAEVSRYFDEHDKLRFVEEWCGARGIPLADVAAVGDSRSDLPLFRRAARAVALNGTAEARHAATCAIDTEDLRDVLRLLTR